MTLIECNCPVCGSDFKKYIGHVNRAKKQGNTVYCGRKCAGISRQKTDEEKKEVKRLYDVQYNKKNEEKRKRQRHEWFMQDYAKNPEKYRKRRKEKQQRHNEYCRRPEYRKKKKTYDRAHWYDKKYGAFGESAALVVEIFSLIDKEQSRFDRNCHNKTQKRKRSCKN